MEQKLIQLSRTMSYALRHNPADFGLTLDVEGWVPVQDLLDALRKRRNEWRDLQIDDLAQVMAQSEKQRFVMHDDKIRAFYGHSVELKMQHEPAIPPVLLYHGTTPQAAKIIRIEGLKPMKRQYVHLSADEETARQVALRRSQRPVILRIDAFTASQQGIAFYLGNDKVWLADRIPPTFIRFL
jgi:putative RNA 2'-phosphotransferase